MVSSDVKDNLIFIIRRQLGWMAGSHFIQGSVALSERSKSSVGNISDLVDFRQGMLVAFNQAQCSASAFWGPLESLHDLIEPLQRNWASIYIGSGASSICNDGGFSWFRDRRDFGRYFPPTVLKHKSGPFISLNVGVSQLITWFHIAFSLSFPEGLSPLKRHH